MQTSSSMEKWNTIVDIVKKNNSASESILQNKWENIFAEIFGYSRLSNEIESQRNVQIGSSQRIIPDIIIRKSSENKDLFIAELKVTTAKHDDGTINARNQLFSYLKQLELDIGLVICDKIYIFYYQRRINDNEQIYIEIPFIKDSKTGENFVELFSKNNYNEEKIIKFIAEIKNKQLDAEKIKDELNIALLEKLTKEYFYEKYDNNIVDSILEKYTFNVERISKVVRPFQESNNASFQQSTKKIETSIENELSKSQAISKFKSIGINITKSCTFSSLNKSSALYWANPKKELLLADWHLILNDTRNRNLKLFKIPANSFNINSLITRTDFGKENLIDLQIKYNDENYIDTRSKQSFASFFVKEVQY